MYFLLKMFVYRRVRLHIKKKIDLTYGVPHFFDPHRKLAWALCYSLNPKNEFNHSKKHQFEFAIDDVFSQQPPHSPGLQYRGLLAVTTEL